MTSLAWLELILSQIWQVTILCVAAGWVERRWLRSRPYWTHQLWSLVLLKSMMPPLWASHCGVFTWLFQRLTGGTVATIELLGGRPTSMTPLLMAFFLIWICGVGARAAFAFRRWWDFRKQLRGSSEPHSELQHVLQTLSKRLQLKAPRLVVSESPIGPAVVGWLRPTIVLPHSLQASPPERLRPTLAHELMHLQRRDTLTALFGWTVQTAWWFFPPIHTAVRAWRNAAEFCCDRDTLRTFRFPRREYAQALLDVLAARVQPIGSQPSLRRDQITTRRLHDIMKSPLQRPPKRHVLIGFLLGCLLFLPGSPFG